MTRQEVQRLNELEEEHQTRYIYTVGLYIPISTYCLLIIFVEACGCFYFALTNREILYENWILFVVLAMIMLCIYIINGYILPYKPRK